MRARSMSLTDLVLPWGALLFVTGLFLVLATVVSRLRRGDIWVGQHRAFGAAGAASRIEVAQSYALDSHRRLILVRCGDNDVLLLVGGPTDLVLLRHGPATSALPPSPEKTL